MVLPPDSAAHLGQGGPHSSSRRFAHGFETLRSIFFYVILERNFYLRPIGYHLAAFDLNVQFDDLGLAQVTQRLGGSFDGIGGTLPGWRRYGLDGYGEDTVTGQGYAKGPDDSNTPNQRGRVWPIFSGERGHYELARLLVDKTSLSPEDLQPLQRNYVQAMEQFANAGLMLPEQVWDNVGKNDVYQYTQGEGTNGATPLAWSHAEYIKLLRSVSDQKVWDRYSPVELRYSTKPVQH